MKYIKNEYILLDCRFLKLLVQAVLCQLFGVQPGPGPHIVSHWSHWSHCEFIFHEVPSNPLIFSSLRFTDWQEENNYGKLISSGYFLEREQEPQWNEVALVNQSTSQHAVASNYSSACSSSDEPEPMGTSDAHPADQLVTMFYTVDPSYFYVQWKSDENNKNEKNKIRSMINTYFRNIGRVEFSATNAQLQVYRSVPVAATCLAC